jgi:hypothetical protein
MTDTFIHLSYHIYIPYHKYHCPKKKFYSIPIKGGKTQKKGQQLEKGDKKL